MAKKNKKLILENKEQELFIFCYENEVHFEQYNQYHYRLFKKGNIVDVWPATQKYWNSKMRGSRVYKTPAEIGTFLFA